MEKNNAAFPGSRFRTSFTSATDIAPMIYGCKVLSTNVKNWTCNVRADHSRRYWNDLQISSPYLHWNRGEGIYVLPEPGAKCFVTVPSDSTPPYISGFTMPFETLPQLEEGQQDGSQKAPKPTAASFSGGRPVGKPGDIVMRGRDGNFVILHRGGTLQIGCSEVAQRIFIPLQNQVLDVSERYTHYNSGGSINWALGDSTTTATNPSTYEETFRVYANDEFADIRVRKGCVQGIGEPIGDAGEIGKVTEFQLGLGPDNPIIYEVAVAKGGFNTYGGSPKDKLVKDQTVFRFFFDRNGGGLVRFKGNFVGSFQKKLHIHTREELTIHSDKSIAITAKEGISIGVGADSTHITGDLVRLGPGTNPASSVGDLVMISLLPIPLMGTCGTPGSPLVGTTIPTVVYGVIKSGRANVRI